MTYIELELPEDLNRKLEELADEEGTSIGELIIEILQDEVACGEEIEDEEYDDEDEDEYCTDVDEYDN